MPLIFDQIGAEALVLASLITLFAGLVKGMVGFAMPMIMISGLSTLIAPDLALAALILPTLVSNGAQALHQGPRAAWQSVRRFGVFLGVGLVMLLISAQFVRVLPVNVMFLLIGGPVVLFTAVQLLGWKPHIARPTQWIEAAVGGFAGFIGGLSGVWGPPTIAYLTAIDTEKRDQMRIQGVVYGLGALALTVAHLQSGVLRMETAPLSALMVVPAGIGMWIGLRLHNRIDQAAFRKATLLVLFIAGLNLIRRGLLG
ncbi:sulfite exporter TauE/SafE family protein [Octadecabacter sp. SW4]|uniref:sulfite exporter TauE/SafE family protein n=1 Tax=Octadecabacter sp. SW4 TaxID=2602067 RepID=UPI0011C1F35F|nr:sulfite exporter TauE/SafE family protein [Octadecabacter sp. SW4]QEE34470.1 sulfite exporter TauE/SafE family protein [Octadecabacter sp. SW4]